MDNSRNIGLKNVSSKKSMFESKQIPSNADFENKAKNVNDNSISNKSRVVELSSQFRKIIEDKTLPENRSPLQDAYQAEIFGKLLELATQLNEDENEPENVGSMALIVLLMKTNFLLKDKINILEYKLSLLETEVKNAEK
jgi:hypothetical protein